MVKYLFLLMGLLAITTACQEEEQLPSGSAEPALYLQYEYDEETYRYEVTRNNVEAEAESYMPDEGGLKHSFRYLMRDTSQPEPSVAKELELRFQGSQITQASDFSSDVPKTIEKGSQWINRTGTHQFQSVAIFTRDFHKQGEFNSFDVSASDSLQITSVKELTLFGQRYLELSFRFETVLNSDDGDTLRINNASGVASFPIPGK